MLDHKITLLMRQVGHTEKEVVELISYIKIIRIRNQELSNGYEILFKKVEELEKKNTFLSSLITLKVVK